MIMCPTIVEPFLNIRFATLLEVKFQAIHFGPGIMQSVLNNCLFRWNVNGSKGVIAEYLDDKLAAKLQMKA